jgi:hypothetical protein
MFEEILESYPLVLSPRVVLSGRFLVPQSVHLPESFSDFCFFDSPNELPQILSRTADVMSFCTTFPRDLYYTVWEAFQAVASPYHFRRFVDRSLHHDVIASIFYVISRLLGVLNVTLLLDTLPLCSRNLPALLMACVDDMNIFVSYRIDFEPRTRVHSVIPSQYVQQLVDVQILYFRFCVLMRVRPSPDVLDMPHFPVETKDIYILLDHIINAYKGASPDWPWNYSLSLIAQLQALVSWIKDKHLHSQRPHKFKK